MWSSSTTSKAKSTASPSKRLSSTTKPTTTTTSTSTTKVAAMPSAKTGVSNTTSAATSPRPLASKASLTTSTKRKAPPPPPPTAPTASRSTTTATTSPNASKMTIAASDDAALPSRHTTAPARKTEAATVGGGGALMSEMSGAPLYTAPSIISPRATTFVSAVSGATLTGGERFEPNFYGTTFSFRGSYHCLEVVECRASLWAANKENGDLDIYSCVTGQLTATLHALSPEQGGGGGGGVLIPPTSSMRAHPPSLSQLMNATGSFTTLPKPTALKSTATHMWVGYDNGYVAVYDHLLLVLITGGHFHDGPVVAFAQLHSEEVVSASENGTLVHWGAEDRNFAAIAAVSPQYTKNKDGAITRLAALLNASSSSVEDEAGLQNTVLCSFASGSMYGVDVVSGRCLLRMRGAHSKRVNDVVVVRSCIFSASEDGTVSIWSFQKEREGTSEPLYDFSAKPLASSTSFTSLRAEHSRTPPPLPPPPAAAATTPTTTSGRAVPHVATERSCRLLKRINVSPCARSFVPDHNTHSIWVAYVDGLLERWSANVDDDFGVEEVIREGLLCGGNASTAPHEVVSLLPLGSIETMQVLALSTNGANKVWYGHRNTVEESGARAVAELQAIIKEDARDTTAWKERIERLKGKERARTTRYVALLESIRNKTLRLQYYERWRRAVVSTSTTAKSVNLSSSLESRTTHRLLRRYFSRWCVFYDRKQRQSRRELLAIALSRSTMRERLLSLLRRWQLGIVRQRVAQTSLACIGVMERSSHALILGRYYYIWMHHAQRKHAVNGKLVHRQRTELSEDQVRLLASKAQRQILHRAMHNWYGAILQRKDLLDGATRGPRYKYAETYARWLERFHARTFFSTWRRWAARRIRHAHLAAVVSLRMQHMSFEVQRIYFAKWLQRAYARRVTQRSLEMRETEAKIHELEAEHKDTFERLQLQKRIEELTRLREEEEDRLRQAQSRAGQLHQQCEEAQRIAAEEGGRPPRTSQLSDGLLSTHAAWHRNLVEQQRLSPAILAHMPLAEASQHVFAQLKGNILNLYTDLSLCRLVKDRRKSGSTAAAIFLESFSELKRVIVSSLKGTNTSTTSGGPGSKRSLRWPLSMEALDSIPAHQCANVLTAIKMFVICFDILSPSELQGILATCEEIVANADWIFLIARTCYLRRKPLLLVNNRQSSSAAKTS